MLLTKPGRILAPRSDRDIERSIAHFDLDRELWHAARKRFTPFGRQVQPVAVAPDYWQKRRGSFLTGTCTELIYNNPAAGTAKNTFTAEFQINDTTGMGDIAILPAAFFLPGRNIGQAFRVVARGILSGVSTNTWRWNFRMNPTLTPANPPTGPIVGGNPGVITPANATVTNMFWEAEMDVQFITRGAPGNNSTLRGAGMVTAPGFGAPTAPDNLSLWGGGTQPGTVATFDWSLINTLTVGSLSGASSGSNQIQLLQLFMFGLN